MLGQLGDALLAALLSLLAMTGAAPAADKVSFGTDWKAQAEHGGFYQALADGTRRDIVRRAIGGEEGVAELAEHYPMSFAAVQKHVAILERAGLVTKVRIGRRKVVRTNLEGLRRARRLLDRYEELWRGRVDRMTALVTDTKETDL